MRGRDDKPTQLFCFVAQLDAGNSQLAQLSCLSYDLFMGFDHHTSQKLASFIQHPCETLFYGPDQPLQEYDPVTGQATSTSSSSDSHSSHRHHATSNGQNNSNSSCSSSSNGGGGTEAVFDYNNPCATGGCLVSQGCGSGQCRLEQLGGRWVCCRCRRGANTFRWCAHPMRRVPDTLCYHTVCLGCWADEDPGQGVA
ncbi:hypothetical protein PGQ11_010828 [Apiospora arundinis]|uniref:Uncharacterized protein n=1 Tax=Apiospora arundinis TaxID=335852 RepID=A0ABR2IAS2_9PEZI